MVRRARRGMLGRDVADDEIADVVDAAAVGQARAHEHVDLAIAEVVARRDFALDLAHDAIGDIARRQAERGGAILVELDLDLGIAAFDGRLDVGEARRCIHQLAETMAGFGKRIEIVAADLDFERRREREELRARELHFGIGVAGHAGAQAIDFGRFDLLAAAVRRARSRGARCFRPIRSGSRRDACRRRQRRRSTRRPDPSRDATRFRRRPCRFPRAACRAAA